MAQGIYNTVTFYTEHATVKPTSAFVWNYLEHTFSSENICFRSVIYLLTYLYLHANHALHWQQQWQALLCLD